MDKRLLYECKILKQIVYKEKNQLGKTIQYRRLMHVYKSLKKYLEGKYVENFELILEKAGISALDNLTKRFLVPIFSILLAIYAKIYSVIRENFTNSTTIIVSRKLKKIIYLSKYAKAKTGETEKKKFKEIESFLESIRNQI